MGVQQKVSGSCAVTVSAPGRCSHVIPGTECTIYVTDTVYGVRDLRQSSPPSNKEWLAITRTPTPKRYIYRAVYVHQGIKYGYTIVRFLNAQLRLIWHFRRMVLYGAVAWQD